ncbi:4398_t:CDS:1 [Funneliformis geosporum]|uniref:7878_t:CDS:1 n=1 Tax=Funneliformis geosporum TaxID=1117311 RepID=A0A9W4WWR3_9GLOM|nr:4398_t:CDS:1 [Funneliformis geosporum]CAI2169300.1 7878_t:CDS:1 [Funneliformis geosporum]
MYIRKSYCDLFEQIRGAVKGAGIIISGTPGIGKSFFAVYLLYQARCNGIPVIYQQPNVIETYVLDGDKCYSYNGTVSDVALKMKDRSLIWYIVDGKVPEHMRMFWNIITILVCSPAREYYKELEKEGVLIYMPLWDVDELEKGFYCTLGPSDKIEEEYEKMWSKVKQWGPIPRAVFYHNRLLPILNHEKEMYDIEKLEKLDVALGRCNMDVIRKTIWAVATGSDNISHRIIHINTLNYLSSSYIFASVYVEERIMNKIMTEEKQKLKEFLQASEGEGQISPMRRTLFEGVAHRCLQNGGTFTVRSLENKTSLPLSIVLQQRPVKWFRNIQDISPDHYNRPIARNFPSSDAIFPSDYIFQITNSKNHAIKWVPLEATIRKLDEIYNDNKRNIGFYFVVPEDKFGNYPEQKFLDQNGKVKKTNGLIMSRVKQYVLEIPYAALI